MDKKKAFVSGCFDTLHPGHVEFLRQASSYGDLYVSLGSDRTIRGIKGITPMYNEQERLFMIRELKPVREAFIASGSGKMDFMDEIQQIKPDYFIVNEDGASGEKERLCEELGIEYVVLKRTPGEGLPGRSSTEMRARRSKLPYRIDLAGGWLDQPYVSKHHPGKVLTVSLEPTQFFHFRSGFATSTRNSAIELWGDEIPRGDPEHQAKILFRYDNPPGTEVVAGSQDSIGIVMPGLNSSFFNGSYWPEKIERFADDGVMDWVEERIHLIQLKPREGGYDVFEGAQINPQNARMLAEASDKTLDGILNKNFERFCDGFTESFRAQTALFPASFPKWIEPVIDEYKDKGAKGYKLSGAGGGGYLILLCEQPIEGATKVKIRRR